MPLELGDKIRMLRQERGLSVKGLAQRARVTSSLLSQIERGRANPSLQSLRNLAVSLEVPIVTFFQEDTPNGEDLVVRRGHRKRLQLPGSHVVYELLSPSIHQQIEFCQMELEPGNETVAEPMSHNGDEAALVQGGPVQLYLEENVVFLDDGDSVYIPAGMRHKWVNRGTVAVRVIFAITPPTF